MSEQSEKDSEWYKNRFTPIRYSFIGSGLGTTEFMPQIKGLYAFPRGEDWIEDEDNFSSSSEEEEADVIQAWKGL